MALNTAVIDDKHVFTTSSRENFPEALRGKRILLTTESLGPVNGVSRTTRSLIDYLHRHGGDLAVVAPRFEGQQQQENNEKQQRPFHEVRIPGYPLPYNPDLTVVYPFHLDDIYRQTFKPDVIYLASPASLGFQMLLLLRQLRCPPVVLLNFQTDLSAYSEILLPAPLDRFAVWLLATVQGYLFRLPAVHTIFYPSSAIRGYLETTTRAPRTRLHKLGRGVDTSLFNPSHRDEAYRRRIAPNGETILVCVCRLAPEKGFEFLAQAAARLADAHLPFKLLIVGGNRNPAVEARIHHLFDAVRAHVLFTGFLAGVDLARAYAAGDLFLHCSVTETFGLVVLEAMASGLPVVARDQGGPSDIIRHGQTGYLVPPDDVDGFVGVVRRVVPDGGLRARLNGAARRYADERTWEAINRRVAWQIADAVEAQPSFSRAPSTPLRRGWALVEKLRLLVAVGAVCLMWLIAVVPLIVHGEIIPRLRGIHKVWK